MPKRSFPRELNRRNRRRIYCSRCGNSYSYSGQNTLREALTDVKAINLHFIVSIVFLCQ